MCAKSKDYVWEKNGENVSGKGSHALGLLCGKTSLSPSWVTSPQWLPSRRRQAVEDTTECPLSPRTCATLGVLLCKVRICTTRE